MRLLALALSAVCGASFAPVMASNPAVPPYVDYVPAGGARDVVQAAIDRVGAAGGGVVQLGPGTFDLGYNPPLEMQSNHVTLRGAGLGRTVITRSVAAATILVGYPPGALQLVAPPGSVSGGGQAWDLTAEWADGHAPRLLNLRDNPAMAVHGLAALSVEFWLTLASSTISSNATLVYAGGTRLSGEGAHSAFRAEIIAIGGGVGVMRTGITTTSGAFQADTPGGVMTAGTHHIACIWNGSTLRVYVDGVQQASTPSAFGTLVMRDYEDVFVGEQPAAFPESGYVQRGLGKLYSLRINSDATRSGAFTAPTVRHAATSGTLALLNFDAADVTDWRVRQVRAAGGYHYYVVRGYGGAGREFISLEDFSLGGGGILVNGTVHFAARNLDIGVNDVPPLHIMDNSFYSLVDHVRANAGGLAPYAIAIHNACGNGRIRDSEFLSGAMGIVITNSGYTVESVTVEASRARANVQVLLGNSGGATGFVLSDVHMSDEDSPTTPDANLGVDGLRSLTVVGGGYERATAGPMVLVSGDSSSLWLNPVFAMQAASEGFHAVDTVGGRAAQLLLQPRAWGSYALPTSWSSTVGLVVVQ